MQQRGLLRTQAELLYQFLLKGLDRLRMMIQAGNV
jgi:hypothetical protein